MSEDRAPTALDPRLFLEDFARRPGMWIGRERVDLAAVFLNGFLCGREGPRAMQEWWDEQYGRSPLAWDAQLLGAHAGGSAPESLTPEQTRAGIVSLCTEVAKFYADRLEAEK